MKYVAPELLGGITVAFTDVFERTSIFKSAGATSYQRISQLLENLSSLKKV